jgi:hypothetical protein
VRQEAKTANASSGTAKVALAALVLLLALAGTSTPSPAQGGNGSAAFGYRFENKRFDISLIEIDLKVDGTGELRFKKGESEDIIDRKVKLLAPTAARIRWLLDTTQFLSSEENYQDKRDFSHLGWHAIWQREGERERNARFNYTTNLRIKELTDIYLGIANQEIDLFSLETAIQFQPLDVPRLLEMLENDLRLERIAEPESLLKPLREIQIDETMALIARNHAKRMVEDIKKGKFKTPVKNK